MIAVTCFAAAQPGKDVLVERQLQQNGCNCAHHGAWRPCILTAVYSAFTSASYDSNSQKPVCLLFRGDIILTQLLNALRGPSVPFSQVAASKHRLIS